MAKSIAVLGLGKFGMSLVRSLNEMGADVLAVDKVEDYVQEIGRAARKLEKGYAIIDYLPSDMHYAQTLWGLSGLRHYQIKAIMKKLTSKSLS